MLTDFITVAIGLTLLFVAGDLLVRGAASAGVKMRVPAILIGLTVVAFGTSAPELFVTIQASLEGAAGIAVGNVVGSNIANVLLVLGLPALLKPLGDHSSEARRSYVIMMFVTVATMGLCYYTPLSLWQGVLLLSMLVGFLYYTYRSAAAARGAEGAGLAELQDADPTMANWKIAALIGAGMIGLPLAADLTVDGARSLASAAGMSEAAIGLTLVALGTSLPELATTLVAALRGRGDMAIGNVIGSNVFNLLCILGVAASMGDISLPEGFLADNMLVMLGSALVLAPYFYLRRDLCRVSGGVFVSAYLLYVFSVAMAPSA